MRKNYVILTFLFVTLNFWTFSRLVFANNIEISPLSTEFKGTVTVQIVSVKPFTDMEGEDEWIPFYNNFADIYGTVIIDGKSEDLEVIENSNFPHWINDKGTFKKYVETNPVPITIKIRETDPVSDDDVVDIKPSDGDDLNITFDMCSFQIRGDCPTQSAADYVEVSGTGDNGATIRFRVSMADNLPQTIDDIVLVDIDVVQVNHHAEYLIAEKPTIVKAVIANTFTGTKTTSMKIRFTSSEPSFFREDTFDGVILSHGVNEKYFYEESPIKLPSGTSICSKYDLKVRALVDPSYDHSPEKDCRVINNSNGNGHIWHVITTRGYNFLWGKVGSGYDLGNFASDEQLDKIEELGQSFIPAIFPFHDVNNYINPIDIIAPITDSAISFLTPILELFGISATCSIPFLLTFELNGINALVSPSSDIIMGVLPHHDWFKMWESINIFGCWNEVTGFSLGKLAPHAVIFLPEYNKNLQEESGPIGPSMSLPAHELGHTFGLSVDPRLKNVWACGIIEDLCGISGELDEYNLSYADKVICNGYWILQGTESELVRGRITGAQTESLCVMDTAEVNDYEKSNWASGGRRWIDSADYDHLCNKLNLEKPILHCESRSIESEHFADEKLLRPVIYVSGMISPLSDQKIYLGPWYHIPKGIPDRTGINEREDHYSFRFLTKDNKVVQEVGLPIFWNYPTSFEPLPVTTFGMFLPYPTGSGKVKIAKIQIWDREENELLAEQPVSSFTPKVKILSPKSGDTVIQGDTLLVSFKGKDYDEDPLTYTILLSPDDSDQWWPIAYRLTDDEYKFDTDDLDPGDYILKVLACDPVHVGESGNVKFSVIEKD